MRNDIPSLISDFLKLVDDFTDLCCNDIDENLNKREQEFIYKISEEAIISLHEKNETLYKSLIDENQF
jgi:hypothetical protein